MASITLVLFLALLRLPSALRVCEQVDRRGLTVLQKATAEGDVDLVKLLLEER